MNSVFNPVVPYNGPIPGGMHPGKIIKIHGSVPPTSHRFAVNLLVGSMGDIGLHISPKFHDKKVIRNSVQSMRWGHEEHHGHLPIYAGQPFDLMILCDHHHFKIAFNGHHFTEFTHRIPYNCLTHLGIEGEVVITSIVYEGHHTSGHNPGHMGLTAPPTYVPGPPSPGHMPYPAAPMPGATMGVPYPSHGRTSPVPHYPHGHVHTHGPVHTHGHGTVPLVTPGYPSAYPTQPGMVTNPYPTQYPHSPTQQHYPHSPNAHKKTGILDKAGMAVAAALGGTALARGVSHGGGHSKIGGLGPLGAVAAGAALTGHNPIKALKKQKKAQKKALKYGLPVVGVGVGAYALHKGMKKMHHGHHRSSSSSSSSSSD